MRTSWRLLSVFLISGLFLFPAAPAVARNQKTSRPKVGLVLSGGGARGAAHVGVLKVLERERIPIDYIAGTSFGALVGGLYAIGYSASEIEDLFLQQKWNQIFSNTPELGLSPLIARMRARYMGHLNFEKLSPELPSGLLYGQHLIELLDSLTTERMIAVGYNFDNLPIPFRCVATNLVDGRKYVFSGGSMTEAIRASAAIPPLFTPIDKDGMLLVDGGLVDNLPTDIVREMGADIVIAVDVTSPLMRKEQIRTLIDVVDQAIGLLMRQHEERDLKLANLVIKPELEGVSLIDYTQLGKIVDSGRRAAEKSLGAVRALVENIPPAGPRKVPVLSIPPIITSISFQGLKMVPASQLRNEVKMQPGQTLDLKVLIDDLRRLYATGLFDHVDYRLEPSGANRYRVVFQVRETPLHTLGAAIRYDRNYKFVALVEVTARQLFHTPSILTLSSQFGGLDEDFARLDYIPSRLPFLFLSPKAFFSRRKRLVVEGGTEEGSYTVRKSGGQLMLGAVFKRLELEAGYDAETAQVRDSTIPELDTTPVRLAGLKFTAYRNTLDYQRFPTTGTYIRLEIQKRSESFGSDVGYSKWYGETGRYFSLSPKATLHLYANAGYSHGELPFYEKFQIGGFNFSEGGPIHLLGYKFDGLTAREMGILAAAYRYRLFSHPLSFVKSGFLTGYYNVAGVSEQQDPPFNFNLFHGIGLEFSLDTLIGPLRLAGGWGEAGRYEFYLSLGPSF